MEQQNLGQDTLYAPSWGRTSGAWHPCGSSRFAPNSGVSRAGAKTAPLMSFPVRTPSAHPAAITTNVDLHDEPHSKISKTSSPTAVSSSQETVAYACETDS